MHFHWPCPKSDNGFDIGRKTTADKQVANAIYDGVNYVDVFERDIIEAEKSVIISSTKLTRWRVERFISIVKPVIERGVCVSIVTGDPDDSINSSSAYNFELISRMTAAGINVITISGIGEHFAVIDKDLVWHGGVNLLGDEDIWDNLIRIKSIPVAAELLEMVLGSTDWEKWKAQTS